MAETKKKQIDEAAVIETEPAAPEHYDPWKDMQQVVVPKKNNGDQESIYVAVNGRPFLVPCTGKPQLVPAPVAEVLNNSQALQDEAEARAAEALKRMVESARAVNLN